MYHAQGIGLAAPQVGVALRVLVMDVAQKQGKNQPITLINPQIIKASDDDNTYEEGCLSVPEHYANVVRPTSVSVRYMDIEGTPKTLDATGLLATCVQHEIDHLDGILFIDHLSSLKKNMILRKLLKARQDN
jgi:peptide deformylase